MALPVIAVPAVARAVPRTGAASVTVGPLPATAAARANAPVPTVTVVATPATAAARVGVPTISVPGAGPAGLPTYVSPIAQTLRVVEHPDGVHQVYVFTAGGTYTTVSQEEAWIFQDLASAYGLVISSASAKTIFAVPATAAARMNAPTIWGGSGTGYGEGVYGEGVYGA